MLYRPDAPTPFERRVYNVTFAVVTLFVTAVVLWFLFGTELGSEFRTAAQQLLESAVACPYADKQSCGMWF